MRPVVNRVKNEYTDTRIIFVADRGLNTSDNIYFLNGDNKGEVNERDGYVYGQSVRGADAEFKAWILEGGYQVDRITDDDGGEIVFMHKSRVYPKQLHVNVTVPGQKKKRKKTVSIDQKQMVYFSAKYAEKQRKTRETMIARAKDLIAHPKKYDRVSASGSASYVKNIVFDKQTGEIIDGRDLSLDLERIEEEELYDGYYSIVTSELQMSDHEMRDVYRGLARIEETFKISKSEFDSRPVYVWTNESIDGHFATCFTALVIMRILQAKLGKHYPMGRILDSLRDFQVVSMGSGIWMTTMYDEILQDCGETFDMALDDKYHTQIEMRRLLRY